MASSCIRVVYFDRGREDRLGSIPPPSEPDRRISRIRLASRWLTREGLVPLQVLILG
jgi:hypothetical protein